jgi:hypothetical protein
MVPQKKYWLRMVSDGIWAGLVAAVLATGCVGVTEGWNSYPPAREVRNKHFEAQVKPARRDAGDGPFQGFLLYIRNLGRNPLEIDWENTYYIQGRDNQGGFIIGDGEVSNHPYFPNPPRRILPERFVQEYLWPQALAPDPRAAAATAEHQALKPGTHGVYLTVLYRGAESKAILPPQADEDDYPWGQALGGNHEYIGNESQKMALSVFLPLSIVRE